MLTIAMSLRDASHPGPDSWLRFAVVLDSGDLGGRDGEEPGPGPLLFPAPTAWYLPAASSIYPFILYLFFS